MSEYENVIVRDQGRAYRVCFHRGTGLVMLVARRASYNGHTTANAEDLLVLEGRRAQQIVALARKARA